MLNSTSCLNGRLFFVVYEMTKTKKIIAVKKNNFIFALRNKTVLTDGVTVALQILVLPVQVRILIGQHKKKPPLQGGFFILTPFLA